MASWRQLVEQAPRITTIFARRHSAAGNLCMLGTLRPDGFPRISPMEPRFFDGDLWLVGMPGTAKFADLHRDPRFTLHTATVDTHVSDGDAKVWGNVDDVADRELQQRFLQDLFDATGLDVRDEPFDHFFRADVVGAAAVEVVDDHLDITTWRVGDVEKVIQKH